MVLNLGLLRFLDLLQIISGFLVLESGGRSQIGLLNGCLILTITGRVLLLLLNLLIMQMQCKILLLPPPLLRRLLMLPLLPNEVLVNPIPAALLIASLRRAELAVVYQVPGVLVPAQLAPIDLAVLFGVALLLFLGEI